MSIQAMVIIVAAAVGLAYGAWAFHCERQRRKRLLSRAPVTIEVWVRMFYPDLPTSARECVVVTLGFVGESLRVERTRLRPDDRFHRELSLRLLPLDDSLDAAIENLCRYVRRETGHKWTPRREIRTLDDLIRDVVAAMQETGETSTVRIRR